MATADWLADYRARLGELPVMARTAPGQVKAQLPAAPPPAPEPFADILADLEKIVVDKIANFSSDRLETMLNQILTKEFRFVEVIGAALARESLL